LQPEQLNRLQQIVFQLRGPQAFGNPELADALQLTPEQRERVRMIQDDRRGPGGPPFFGGGPGFMPGGPRADWSPPWQGGFRPPNKPQPGDPKKPAEQALEEQLMNVLTAEQKTKWQEMLGAPFRGELRGSAPMTSPLSDFRSERR
jgi:hypothetical protein